MSDWNSDLPTLYSGTVPDADDWAAITTLLTSLTDAETDFAASLSWTASVSNPAIGNGTITSRYKRYGKTVLFAVDLTMGSTSTFGSGYWRIGLPITALAQVPYLGCGLTFDSSVGTARTPAAMGLESTTVAVFYGSNGLVTATTPFTWAQSDQLRGAILYEAA